AALAAVGVHGEVDADDGARAGAGDEALDLLLRGVVGEVAHVEGAIGRCRGAAAAAAPEPAAARRTASDAVAAGTTLTPGRLRLEGPDRDRLAALERPVEGLARSARLLLSRQGHEPEPTRPAGRAILGEAHLDDG